MADNYVSLRLRATDDAKPDLADLKLKLDELKGKVAEARANVDDVQADAKLTALEARLAALSKRIASPRIDMAGGARAIAELTAVDAAMTETGDKAGIMAAKTRLAGLNAAKGLGLFSGAAAALSMAGPFAAAGLAVAAFGAVAIPVLTKVATAHTALVKAEQQYANASTSKQRTTALKAEAAATAGLTDQQKGLMGQVAGLQKAWQGIEAALTPVVVDVAKVAIALARDLMPAFKSLAEVGGNALETILGYLGQFVRTPFFAQMISQMSQLASQVAPLLGQSLVGVLKVFLQLFTQAGPAGLRILSVLLPLIVQLATDLVPVIAVVANVVAAILEWLQKTHLLIPLLAVLAVVILAMEAPITAIIIAIALLVAAGVELGRHWGQIWHAIAHYFDEGRHFIAHVFDLIIHYAGLPIAWIRAHWPLLVAILTGPIGVAVYAISRHWGQVTAGASRMFHDVVGFFTSLPKRILSALGDLGHLLWNAGVSILKGLLGGLVQQFDDVKNFVSGIGSWIANNKGPIEVDAVLLRPHGRAIMSGLVGGLQDGMPGLSGQMQRTTAAITGGARHSGGPGGYGGGRGQLELVLRFAPSGNAFMDAFMRELRGEVRVLGGDPLMFQRKVAFRT